MKYIRINRIYAKSCIRLPILRLLSLITFTWLDAIRWFSFLSFPSKFPRPARSFWCPLTASLLPSCSCSSRIWTQPRPLALPRSPVYLPSLRSVSLANLPRRFSARPTVSDWLSVCRIRKALWFRLCFWKRRPLRSSWYRTSWSS